MLWPSTPGQHLLALPPLSRGAVPLEHPSRPEHLLGAGTAEGISGSVRVGGRGVGSEASAQTSELGQVLCLLELPWFSGKWR